MISTEQLREEVLNAKTTLLELFQRFTNEMTDMQKKTLVKAYNDYQELERDGVDYIFDLHNSEDVACLAKSGKSVPDLFKAYQYSRYAMLDGDNEFSFVELPEKLARGYIVASFTFFLTHMDDCKSYREMLNECLFNVMGEYIGIDD